jgi:hypothetical protein
MRDVRTLGLALVTASVALACGPSEETITGSPGSSSSSSSQGGSGNGSSSSTSSGGSGTGGSEPLPSADFEARCAAEGVLVCRGFDSADELNQISLETETGAEADGEGTMDHISIDTSMKTSGAGALRFEIVGQTGSNHSGAYRQLMGQAFGEGTSFYAQFRLRLSSEFVGTQWDSVVGSSPKIVIFHHSSATCNDIEWTQMMNGWYSHIATMYTHCGQFAPGGTDSDSNLQQGDFTCPYGSDYANDPNCFKYPAEQWMTFYFKATMGQWGEPNSHLQAWVSIDGEPYKSWIDDPAFTLYAEGESTEGFNSAYLTTYMTNKDASADHPTAYVWYDELIVSTQPIAVPSVR